MTATTSAAPSPPLVQSRFAITPNVYVGTLGVFLGAGIATLSARLVSVGLPDLRGGKVTPEKVDAYEIGYKGRLSDRLNVSVAAFHSIYKDIQVFVYNPIAGSTFGVGMLTGGLSGQTTAGADGAGGDGTSGGA